MKSIPQGQTAREKRKDREDAFFPMPAAVAAKPSAQVLSSCRHFFQVKSGAGAKESCVPEVEKLVDPLASGKLGSGSQRTGFPAIDSYRRSGKDGGNSSPQEPTAAEFFGKDVFFELENSLSFGRVAVFRYPRTSCRQFFIAEERSLRARQRMNHIPGVLKSVFPRGRTRFSAVRVSIFFP
jgi:hypothetical protein